jgi:V/A-type H+-transporting ATPase subunit I
MSVASLKKVYLVVPPKNKQRLLNLLQQKGIVQIGSQAKILPAEYVSMFRQSISTDNTNNILEVEKRVAEIKWIIDYLESLEEDKSFIKSLVQGKEVIKREEFEKLCDYDYLKIISEAREYLEQENNITSQLTRKKSLVDGLAPLNEFSAPLEEYAGTKKTFALFVVSRGEKPDELIPKLESALGDESFIKVINNQGRNFVISVTGRKERKKQFLEKVDNLHLEILDSSSLTGTAEKNIDNLNGEINTLIAAINEIKDKQAQLVKNLPVLHELFDFWNAQLECMKKETNLLQSKYTSLITGWIREKDIIVLTEAINSESIGADLFFIDPDPGDDPPVEYDNPPQLKPFEFISDLYSRPKYWEVDPTPFLSAFFVLFFGICLTDAGYGLFLAAVTFYMLKKFHFQSESGKKLVKVLFYSGITTAIVGFLTGGFFGLPVAVLPGPLSFLKNIILIDPLKNQMAFLIFTLALGVIHIGFGISIKLIRRMKNGDPVGALLDQGPFMSILLGIVLIGLSSALNIEWLKLAAYLLMIIGGLVILIFAGRSSSKLAGRIGQGIYSLYSVTGLLGDILSYARLFALGIATAVIAQVVNFIASIAFGVPVLGYIFMPVILIAGHLMNIAINSLGGFIHTTRLQFVEFFGKFYEGGGESFQPFSMKLKYTKIN